MISVLILYCLVLLIWVLTLVTDLDTIQNDLDNQFKSIFTPEQYTAYTTKKAEMKGKMKARRAEKQDDTPFDLD